MSGFKFRTDGEMYLKLRGSGGWKDEQCSGSIDRKLQPAKQVFFRYFRYEQREAEIVLELSIHSANSEPAGGNGPAERFHSDQT